MQRIQSAKTVEDAKAEVMKDLHLDEFDSFELEVLQEPSKGFLGLGSKEARVKLVVKTDKVAKALHLVREMTDKLGFKPEFQETVKDEGKQLVLRFSGEESANLKGSLGRSIHKFEFLLNNMINRKDRDGYLKAICEFEGEEREAGRQPRGERKPNPRTQSPRDRKPEGENSKRESNSSRSDRPERSQRPPRGGRDGRGGDRNSRPPREGREGRSDFRRNENTERPASGTQQSKPHRERFLVNMARKMANQVLETHKTVHLNPMNSYDRRIIHTELNEIENISTSSDGEGDRRHIVIQFKE